MSGTIGYASNDGVRYLKLAGDLRHDGAGPLEALIDRWFADPPSTPCAVVIDLNDAQFMDSTVIGLLASIAREMLARGLPTPTVFSTNPEINQLLSSLRLDEVFTLVQRATDRRPVAGEMHDAEEVSQTQQCSGAAILNAHEALIDLNEANRVAFQPVVDVLREEFGHK